MAFELTPFIKSTSDDSRFSDALDFFGDVAKGTAQGVVSGICGTAGDLIEGCTHVAKGEFGKAGRIAARRAAGVVAGAVNVVESSVGLAASGADALLHDRDFLTEKNKARMTAVCQAAVYARRRAEHLLMTARLRATAARSMETPAVSRVLRTASSWATETISRRLLPRVKTRMQRTSARQMYRGIPASGPNFWMLTELTIPRAGRCTM